LLALRYEPRLSEIIIVHGGAREERYEIVQDANPLIKIVHTKKRGKTTQLNIGMSVAHGDVYMITDVDAEISQHAIWDIMRALDDPQVGVVGLWCSLSGGTVIDKFYWYVANWIRVIESKFWTCSHVVAPCYAFDADYFIHPAKIPEDVVADDVYISFYYNFIGKRVRYLRSSRVVEKRAPKTIVQFIKHKARKGNAVLRELLRFMYELPYAPMRWKIIYAARLIQFTILTPTILLTYPFYRQDSCYEKCKK